MHKPSPGCSFTSQAVHQTPTVHTSFFFRSRFFVHDHFFLFSFGGLRRLISAARAILPLQTGARCFKKKRRKRSTVLQLRTGVTTRASSRIHGQLAQVLKVNLKQDCASRLAVTLLFFNLFLFISSSRVSEHGISIRRRLTRFYPSESGPRYSPRALHAPAFF